jgi:hypothetical protein
MLSAVLRYSPNDAVLLVRDLRLDSIRALASYHELNNWDNTFREWCDSRHDRRGSKIRIKLNPLSVRGSS